jgi:GNAT superfamily N-acetyltransferase
MITIRPFAYTDADYEATIRISNAVYPDQPETVGELRHSDQTRDPKFDFGRYLVELDGQIVATGIYCEPWWSHKPGKYFVNLTVDPSYQGRGVGSQFYDFLIGHVLAHDPVVVTSGTREDKAASINFLTKRGYRQVQREQISELDIEAFDPSPFAQIPDKVAARGITVKSLAQIAADDPEWKRRLWQLEAELLVDVPGPDPITIDSFEVFTERDLGSPSFLVDGQFIALDGEHWVGMTALWASEADPELLFTGLTGVRREYRRRGIATALKLRGISFARRYGAKTVETGNDDDNPMYQINLRLGFKPKPAWLTFEKQLEHDDSGQRMERTE